MITGEGTVEVERPAKDVYEFVTDLSRYMLADQKIRKIYSVKQQGDVVELRTGGLFRGIATPAAVQYLSATPYSKVRIWSKPYTLAHVVMPFEGLFTFESITENRTRVFHRETFNPPRPFKWALEAYLGDWLTKDVQIEMQRLKELLEAGKTIRAKDPEAVFSKQ